MIDETVFNLLSQHAGEGVNVVPVTDTVTSGLPKLIFNLIHGPRTHNDDGADGILAATYQLDVFAPTLLAARTIADAVRIALDGYANAGTGVVWINFPEIARPYREQTVSGQNFVVARVMLEMTVSYRE